jgi:Leucine-rich repeat (LRR) protein
MQHVTVPIVAESGDGRMEDLYFDVFDALAEALRNLAPEYAAGLESYLEDARRDGAGLSLTDELVFGFPMPGGLCETEALACAHHFGQLVVALEPALRPLTAALGYRLVPRLPEDAARCECLVCERVRAGDLPHVTVPKPPGPPSQPTTFERISDAMKHPEMCDQLDINDQGLWRLPPDIDRMINLTGITAFNNGFSQLPPVLFTMPNLVWLDFERNQIDTLPDNIGQARQLEVLCLASNHLQSLPASICDLVALRRLTLGGSRIAELPAGFERLQRLVELDLARLGLTTLPDFTAFAALEILELDEQRCPEAIEHLDLSSLTKLKRLSIPQNKLRVLPTLSPGLEELDASNNPLTNLPADLPPSLARVTLRATALTEIPAWPHVKELRLGDCRQLGTLSDGLTGLTKLDIGHTDVRRIPAGLRALRELTCQRGQLDDAELARLEGVELRIYG